MRNKNAGSRPRRPIARASPTSLGWSDYKGLWLTANRRLNHGLQFQGSYTLSKSTDTNSYDGTLTAQNNFDLAGSVGASDFDVRHRFSLNATWELPIQVQRRSICALSAVAHALMTDPQTLDEVTNAVAPQAQLEPELVLRGARQVQAQIERAVAQVA